MKKLHALLKKLGFTQMAPGWGNTWTRKGWEVQIFGPDWESKKHVVHIEGDSKQWRGLNLKQAVETLKSKA